MNNEVKNKSITKNDAGDARRGDVWQVWLGAYRGGTAGLLPPYWSRERDAMLRQTLYTPFHDFWTGAIGIAITKMASLTWIVESDAPRLCSYAQELLLAADSNSSWVSFLGRHLQDYLCTDNGAFIEIVRASNSAGSRIIGLVHLDSLRCTRTGDAEIPVLYRDTTGELHEVKTHQVISFSDMPSPSETWHGVGMCAASRAWGQILKSEAIERYIFDKVSGERALSLDLVKGISDQSIKTGMDTAREQREARSTLKGAYQYLGAVVLPVLDDVPLQHQRINFAELPDGFDRKEELNISLLAFANAIGLDPQDLQPLTGQALGTGAQSQVLHEKAAGKGLASWRQQFTHSLNQFVMPNVVTFAFSEKDLRDQQSAAQVTNTRIDGVTKLVEKQIITPAQAAQMLSDSGDIPKEFVPNDQTAGGTLTDSEQAEAEQDAQDQRANADTTPADQASTPTLKQMRMEFYDAMQRFNEAMK